MAKQPKKSKKRLAPVQNTQPQKPLNIIPTQPNEATNDIFVPTLNEVELLRQDIDALRALGIVLETGRSSDGLTPRAKSRSSFMQCCAANPQWKLVRFRCFDDNIIGFNVSREKLIACYVLSFESSAGAMAAYHGIRGAHFSTDMRVQAFVIAQQTDIVIQATLATRSLKEGHTYLERREFERALGLLPTGAQTSEGFFKSHKGSWGRSPAPSPPESRPHPSADSSTSAPPTRKPISIITPKKASVRGLAPPSSLAVRSKHQSASTATNVNPRPSHSLINQIFFSTLDKMHFRSQRGWDRCLFLATKKSKRVDSVQLLSSFCATQFGSAVEQIMFFGKEKEAHRDMPKRSKYCLVRFCDNARVSVAERTVDAYGKWQSGGTNYHIRRRALPDPSEYASMIVLKASARVIAAFKNCFESGAKGIMSVSLDPISESESGSGSDTDMNVEERTGKVQVPHSSSWRPANSHEDTQPSIDEFITAMQAAELSDGSCRCDTCSGEPDSRTYWPESNDQEPWKISRQTGKLVFQHVDESGSLPWFHSPGNNPLVTYIGYEGAPQTQNNTALEDRNVSGSSQYCKICEESGHREEECVHYHTRFKPRDRRNSSSDSGNSDGTDISAQSPPPAQANQGSGLFDPTVVPDWKFELWAARKTDPELVERARAARQRIRDANDSNEGFFVDTKPANVKAGSPAHVPLVSYDKRQFSPLGTLVKDRGMTNAEPSNSGVAPASRIDADEEEPNDHRERHGPASLTHSQHRWQTASQWLTARDYPPSTESDHTKQMRSERRINRAAEREARANDMGMDEGSTKGDWFWEKRPQVKEARRPNSMFQPLESEMKSHGWANTGQPYTRGACANPIDVDEEDSDDAGVEVWNAEYAMRGINRRKP